ncbi:MAG: insulinase family protein, partial [Longimicrobiales bacterium]|nr:insulinase family protein [Longimicrobiales bacterium]
MGVNLWYAVGSRNERPGRTGFAHLFEHMMFQGSANVPKNRHFELIEQAGGSLNASTWFDRTNYYETLPANHLELALWLESDRMGHMIGAINQENLDTQRGVVQNEKRQHQNRPYGRVFELLAHNTWPEGHPYSWEVIGSMDDLNAASLEDVHEWFRSYYGAANAVLSVAGDVEAAEVKEKVEKYFGAIPPGPPLERHEAWTARRTGSKRMQMQDRVPQARIIKTWNIPAWGTADADYLDLAAGVLAWGKSSRLEKRLVMDEQIATNVMAYARTQEIAGQFMISATARPGVDLARVEQAIDEEIERFLKTGPTETELERIKTIFYAGFVRGVEKIGGFGGKSDVLAECEVFGGSPDSYKVSVERT